MMNCFTPPTLHPVLQLFKTFLLTKLYAIATIQWCITYKHSNFILINLAQTNLKELNIREKSQTWKAESKTKRKKKHEIEQNIPKKMSHIQWSENKII